jgi:hypothetical protein
VKQTRFCPFESVICASIEWLGSSLPPLDRKAEDEGNSEKKLKKNREGRDEGQVLDNIIQHP